MNSEIGNRVGEAVISEFRCPICQDTGIQWGSADLDGEKVMVLRICKCREVVNDNAVQYDF